MTRDELLWFVGNIVPEYWEFFSKNWVTDERIGKAMYALHPLDRERLKAFIGATKDTLCDVKIPKKRGGGYMKPTYPNARYALLNSLHKLAQEIKDSPNEYIKCPHCQCLIGVKVIQ